MTALPTEIHEEILSYLPFINLIPLRRVSQLWNLIILHLVGRTKQNSYLSSWTMCLFSSSGVTHSIPLKLESTRDAIDWNDIYHRPYIFSGQISGISRTDQAEVLKLQFWDTKQGEYIPETTSECQFRCCGLCDITVWPWSTLPLSRQGPLGEVIKWRDLYKIDLWESHWDEALLRKRNIEQHIGAAWAAAGPPIIPMNQGHVNIFMGTPVQMTNQGYIAVHGAPRNSFSPNEIRIALSYSAICAFLLVQKRRERFHQGGMWQDAVASMVMDPKMRQLALQARIGCGCKLVDWEHEDVGIKVIRLEDSESNKFDRFR
jgi:hypothetical protein